MEFHDYCKETSSFPGASHMKSKSIGDEQAKVHGDVEIGRTLRGQVRSWMRNENEVKICQAQVSWWNEMKGSSPCWAQNETGMYNILVKSSNQRPSSRREMRVAFGEVVTMHRTKEWRGVLHP